MRGEAFYMDFINNRLSDWRAGSSIVRPAGAFRLHHAFCRIYTRIAHKFQCVGIDQITRGIVAVVLLVHLWTGHAIQVQRAGHKVLDVNRPYVADAMVNRIEGDFVRGLGRIRRVEQRKPHLRRMPAEDRKMYARRVWRGAQGPRMAWTDNIRIGFRH